MPWPWPGRALDPEADKSAEHEAVLEALESKWQAEREAARIEVPAPRLPEPEAEPEPELEAEIS